MLTLTQELGYTVAAQLALWARIHCVGAALAKCVDYSNVKRGDRLSVPVGEESDAPEEFFSSLDFHGEQFA